MLIRKQQKDLVVLVDEIRRSRSQLATRGNPERSPPNKIQSKSTLTNPVLWLPFIAGLTLTFYKSTGFASQKTSHLMLQLARSAFDTVKTERKLELAKRQSGFQPPDEFT